MNDLANQIATTQHFAIEFEDQGVNRLMSVKFWKDNTLCRVYVCRSGLPSSDLTGELGSLSRLLSVVSTKADIVACSGCPVELIQTIDNNVFFPRAVQSCFRFEHLQLQKMMHKPTFSVFGRIDFFSVLKCLVVSLGAASSEDWALQSPELARVSILSSNMKRKGLGGRFGQKTIRVRLGYRYLQTGLAEFTQPLSGTCKTLEGDPAVPDVPYSTPGNAGGPQSSAELRVVSHLRLLLHRQVGVLPTHNQ